MGDWGEGENSGAKLLLKRKRPAVDSRPLVLFPYQAEAMN